MVAAVAMAATVADTARAADHRTGLTARAADRPTGSTARVADRPTGLTARVADRPTDLMTARAADHRTGLTARAEVADTARAAADTARAVVVTAADTARAVAVTTAGSIADHHRQDRDRRDHPARRRRSIDNLSRGGVGGGDRVRATRTHARTRVGKGSHAWIGFRQRRSAIGRRAWELYKSISRECISYYFLFRSLANFAQDFATGYDRANPAAAHIRQCSPRPHDISARQHVHVIPRPTIG